MSKTWMGTDSGYRKGRWKNKRSHRVITGHYRWNRAAQYFSVIFDKGTLSGMSRQFAIYEDEPHVNNWRFLGRNEANDE